MWLKQVILKILWTIIFPANVKDNCIETNTSREKITALPNTSF